MLIASFVSLGAVTLYTVPYEVMTRLRVIPSSMMGTLYPAFSERGLEGQQPHLQRLYERSVRYLLLVLLPGILFLVVLGPDALTLWMGHAFAVQTGAILQILAVGVLANGIAYVPYNMLQAVGRPDLTGKFHLLELPPYVTLCLLLIPRWGITGAALASTIRFVLDAALLFWAVRKYCHCSLRGFWLSSFRGIGGLTLVLAAGFISIRMLVFASWMRVGAGALCSLLFVALAWALVIDKGERPALGAALRIFRSQPVS
jgi:O-antigen/teichoic acid export membrane protein